MRRVGRERSERRRRCCFRQQRRRKNRRWRGNIKRRRRNNAVEAAQEAEWEYRAQGWRFDELLEEFWRHQQREEKQREVDTKDWGPCLGCQSRKIDCV